MPVGQSLHVESTVRLFEAENQICAVRPRSSITSRVNQQAHSKRSTSHLCIFGVWIRARDEINRVIANTFLIDYNLVGIISVFGSYTTTYQCRNVF